MRVSATPQPTVMTTSVQSVDHGGPGHSKRRDELPVEQQVEGERSGADRGIGALAVPSDQLLRERVVEGHQR